MVTKNYKQFGQWAALLFIGILIGGFLFSRSQPRSFLNLRHCDSLCYKPSDVMGLVGSITMKRFSYLIPGVVYETDTVLAIKNPIHDYTYHFVIIPKKDIKNIGEVSEADFVYIHDAYAVAQELIKQNHIKKYRLTTNGPSFQQVTYLHFHLIADE